MHGSSTTKSQDDDDDNCLDDGFYHMEVEELENTFLGQSHFGTTIISHKSVHINASTYVSKRWSELGLSKTEYKHLKTVCMPLRYFLRLR